MLIWDCPECGEETEVGETCDRCQRTNAILERAGEWARERDLDELVYASLGGDDELNDMAYADLWSDTEDMPHLLGDVIRGTGRINQTVDSWTK